MTLKSGKDAKKFLCLLPLLLILIGWNSLHIIYVSEVKELREEMRSHQISSNPYFNSTTSAFADLRSFRYVLNSPCESSTTSDSSPWNLVVLVTSNARNFDLRVSHRDAFPEDVLRKSGIRRVFLLAVDKSQSQKRIEEEDLQFGDIVQGNFGEHYHNLTYKHLMGLHWAANYCSNSRYIVKMDDDIVVDFFQLLAKLATEYPSSSMTNAMLGYKQMGLTPQRDPGSKWFVTRTEFEGSTFPDFLSGWAYVTTPQVAEKLVKSSRTFPFFWIDDVFVTGLLAAREGVQLMSLNSLFTVYAEYIDCCLEQQQEPRFMCDFIVGPSKSDGNVIRRFGRLARQCHVRSGRKACERRPWEKSVTKTCVHVDNPFFLPETGGVGQVIALSNRL